MVGQVKVKPIAISPLRYQRQRFEDWWRDLPEAVRVTVIALGLGAWVWTALVIL
jgi:hypothetical protein